MKKVYLCSSLKPENYEYVSRLLSDGRLPQAIYLRPRPGSLPSQRTEHVEIDVAMIKHCDELWVVGCYGRDCSWEIGYAMALNKPIVVFKDQSNFKLLEEDWMIYHGYTKGILTIYADTCEST